MDQSLALERGEKLAGDIVELLVESSRKSPIHPAVALYALESAIYCLKKSMGIGSDLDEDFKVREKQIIFDVENWTKNGQQALRAD
jgi:hypothetical protein